jgi:hypothetical protein
LRTPKQFHAPALSKRSVSAFVRILLLEYLYGDGMTTLKTKNVCVRTKAVAVLVSEEAVRQVDATLNASPRKFVRRSCELRYGRWMPLSMQVRGNLCG